MSARVEMDVVLPHAPEQVWRALTEAGALAEWLMPNDFKPRLGHQFRFRPRRGRDRGLRGEVRCEVVELEAPRRLAYTWREQPEQTPDLVTWTLEPVEAGTRLRLEHTGPADLRAQAGAAPRFALPGQAEMVARLARRLAGKSGRARRRGRIVFRGEGALLCVSPFRSTNVFEEVG